MRKTIFTSAISLVIIGLVIISTAMSALTPTQKTEIKNKINIGIPKTYTSMDTTVSHIRNIRDVDIPNVNSLAIGEDVSVFPDGQNPAIVTDRMGNILILVETIQDIYQTDIWGRWSTDGGENWVDEGSIVGWQFSDDVKRPKIDYNEGMNAWGTLTPGHDANAVVYCIDFPDITDPNVPSPTSPDGWTAWSVDWGDHGFSCFDSADVACYPYTPGISPSSNFWGCIAITGDSPDEDNTVIFLFFTADGQVRLVTFENMGVDVDKITCDIDQSLGQFYMVMEYISETNPADTGILFVKAPPLAPNDDWCDGDYSCFIFPDISNPDIIAADGSVYIIGETEINGHNDIVCLYSHNAGVSFASSAVTTTDVHDVYPTISIIEEYLTCTYIRDGDLFVSVSDDGGVNWNEDERVNDLKGSVIAGYNSHSLDGQYATWTGLYGVYFDDVFSFDPPPYLEISINPAGIRIRATIWNHGYGNAEDTVWNITIDGGLLLTDREFSGLIDKISVDTYENVASSLIFGIGKVSITIKATPSNGKETVLKTNGFIFGPFYISI